LGAGVQQQKAWDCAFLTNNIKSGKRSEERLRCGVVAERLADVREVVHISRAENKASPKLKWILAEFVLAMTRCAGPFAASGVIFAKKMEQIRRTESHGLIRVAVAIDQQREPDSRFLAKHACVVRVAQADGGQRSFFVPEGLLLFAQLRDMLAAENSSVMPEKDKHRGATGPKRPKPDFLAIRIGKHNFSEPAAEGLVHDDLILRSTFGVVKSNRPTSDSVRLPSAQ
jgi:hypothetical protein